MPFAFDGVWGNGHGAVGLHMHWMRAFGDDYYFLVAGLLLQ
jgi:hypothetical protein